MSDSSEKTEAPTGKRLKEARERGQIARSRDLVQVGSLFGAMWVLASQGPSMIAQITRLMVGALRSIETMAGHDLDIAELTSLLTSATWSVTLIVGPVALTAMAAVVALNVLQGGWIFAPEALKLDWSRLSPATGLSRLAPSRAGLDLVKVLILTTTLVILGVNAVEAMTQQSVTLTRLAPLQSAWIGWDAASSYLRSSAIVMLVAGVADYGLQKYRLTSSLKMTKGEVRDDARLSEGSPEIKARVRRVQREMMKRRMLRATKHATVVITNPTHYAVALVYERQSMAAPKVVAKGKGVLAARIRAIATEHGVPIVENVALAQALHKTVEVGETIPGSLFKAVAEVLSYLIRLKQLSL